MKKLTVVLGLLVAAFLGQAQTVQQADSLHRKGIELLNTGNIEQGRQCARQALEMRRQLLGELNQDCIMSLNNYAYSYAMEQDYATAVRLQEKVMELCARLDAPHPSLGMFGANMGRYYFMTSDTIRAVETWERALPLVEKFGPAYEYILNSLTAIYIAQDNKQGMARIMPLIEEHNRYELTKPCDEPLCMVERAQYYATTGDMAMAKEWFVKALALPMDDATQAQVREAYGRHLAGNVRDFAGGSDYLQSAAGLHKRIDGETEAYANLMYHAGVYAYLGKKYDQAIDDYKAADAFYAKLSSPRAPKSHAQCLKGLGNVYSAMHDYASAIDCFTRLVGWYQSTDTTGENYPKALLRLAKAEKFNKDYAASIEHHKQAMDMFDCRGMTGDYDDAAASLQLCYRYAGINENANHSTDRSQADTQKSLDEIIQSELEGLEMTKNYLGQMQYAKSLGVLAGCYGMKQDYDNSVNYYGQYIPVVRDAIRQQFSLMSERERAILWSDEHSTITNMMELLIDLPQSAGNRWAQMSGIAFDAALLSKGILLNSAIEFDKVLAAKGDTHLQRIYSQTKANEAKIENLRRNANVDLDQILRLTQQNQQLQLQLYRGCSEYADFTNYIGYTWQDVRQALEPGDVAIEFVMVGSSIFSTDNQLMALVLTGEATSPLAFRVCSAHNLNQLEQNADLYDSPQAADVIWTPLSTVLNDKKRIFFSPDGLLNRIAIEYLQVDGRPLSEQVEVYRLSSTKVLCNRHKAHKLESAALFGDINYNDEATVVEQTTVGKAVKRGADGLAVLAGTLREVNEIKAIMERHHVDRTALLCDTQASKRAFMRLDGSGVNLLHIATHGMFYDTKGQTEAQSMQNSMLALAGANVDDDAFVTAAEIASMDLRQCQLVVLSACETGLGKLGGDGVFGLQRGFKNAGAHTLLMSLKSVYDNTTADLMVAFYNHLMEGDTPRQALVKAQKHIRDKGFDDPNHWAVFILLDAFGQ